MTSTPSPTAPWQAVMADEDGFVMSDEHIALWATNEREAARITTGPPTQLVIVRDTASPRPQSPGSEFYRLPGSWMTSDRFLELDVDPEYNDVEDLGMLWERAKAAVAGMNAAAVQ